MYNYRLSCLSFWDTYISVLINLQEIEASWMDWNAKKQKMLFFSFSFNFFLELRPGFWQVTYFFRSWISKTMLEKVDLAGKLVPVRVTEFEN